MQTEPIVYAGFQNGIIYAQNEYGRPNATGMEAYTGLAIYGTKVYSLTLPATRKIPHIGNDRLLKVQQFPPTDAASGEISVDGEDLDVIALLTGATIVEKAGMKMLPHLSDLAGSEPNVSMILYQAALAESGPQRFHFHMITSTKAVVRLPGFAQEPVDLVYDIAPDPVERYPWGMDLEELDDPSDPFSGVSESGAFNAGVWSGFSEYKPRIASFIAGAGETEFLFPLSLPAVDTDKILVVAALEDTVEEVDETDYAPATTGVTFDTAPTTTYGAGVEIHILYQHA